MRIRHAVPAFLVFSLTFTIVSLPAASFPGPGGDPDRSMIGFCIMRSAEIAGGDIRGRIVIGLEGPQDLRVPVGTGDWEVRWIKVRPGTYSVEESDVVIPSRNAPGRIEVPPGSVILAPFVLVRDSDAVRILPIDEEIRQRAGRDLASHVDFPLWSGRNLIGFGALRPDVDSEVIQYNISVRSETPDSEVYVDDVLVGRTPLDFALAGGKHRILVRAEGYEDAVYYVRLEGDAEINAELAPAAAAVEVGDGAERYRTLVGPFLSLDEPDDQLARLFADTLLLALEPDPRLEPVPTAVPWTRKDALIHPDFLPLEEVGADLVVSGFFGMQEGRLTVQANLYDVQAETVRAAVTWLGTAGFDIFDAMDEIAVEFADEVDRVLPEAGRTLVTRRETVYSGVSRSTGLLARKKIVRRRWEDDPNTFSLQSGMGGMFEEIEIQGSVSTDSANRYDGPVLPLLLTWDHDVSRMFSLGLGAHIMAGPTRRSDDTDVWTAMGGLFGGPRLLFRSLRSDIVFSLDLQVQYAPEMTYYWDEGTPDQGKGGPYLYLNLPLKIGFRYYVNRRTDRMPWFISGGVGLSPVGYRFDLNDRGQSDWIGTDLILVLGTGIRL